MADIADRASGPGAFSLSGNRPLIAVAAMTATVMQVIDTTITNVALPHIQGGFAVTQDQITWILTSYIVTSAIAMPLTGWLAGRLGRKRVFLLSVVGFTLASGLCGAAQSLPQIVAFRALQGVCGAALVPLSQAVLLDAFPGEQRGPAMALWGVGVMVGPILGPTLGGYLTDNFDWRWVFYINLPVGVLAWFGIFLAVSETPRDRTRPFDFMGFAMLGLAIGSLQLMLDRGEIKDWFASTEILAEAALAILGAYSFVVHAATSPNPFINAAILKDRNFAASLIFGFVLGLVLLASVALLAPMLQMLMNYPVLTTGLAMAPRGLGTMITMLLCGRLIRRVDARLPMLAGFLITAYSLWDMANSFSLQMDTWTVVSIGFIQGLGLGLVFPPLSVLAFATLPPRLRTEATGISNLARNLGSSIGVSVVTAMLAVNTQIVHARLAAHVTPYNPLLRFPAISGVWDMQTPAGLSAINEEVTRQSALIAYVDDFRLIMIIVLVALPAIFLMRSQTSPARAP
jgi:DHA2 family multidrug resistance protein